MKKGYDREKVSKLNRLYYLKHKKDIIKRIRRTQIKNNYASEKTEKQRRIRDIKRGTRRRYPLFKCLKCSYCSSPATEHHHYTSPIKINKFEYICHPGHTKHNTQIKNKL